MPTAKVNDAELYYEVHGRGTPLVLSHHGFADSSDWKINLPALTQRYQVVVYDRRGCGRSKAPAGTDSAETWVEDLYQLMRHLGIAKAHVGGMSYGAFIALEFLFAHQDMVETGILISGTSQGFGGGAPGRIPFPNRVPQLSQIQVPVLIIHGESDAGFPPSVGEVTHKGIPRSRLVVIPGAGHVVNVDNPQAFNDAVLSFLAEVEAGAYAR